VVHALFIALYRSSKRQQQPFSLIYILLLIQPSGRLFFCLSREETLLLFVVVVVVAGMEKRHSFMAALFWRDPQLRSVSFCILLHKCCVVGTVYFVIYVMQCTTAYQNAVLSAARSLKRWREHSSRGAKPSAAICFQRGWNRMVLCVSGCDSLNNYYASVSFLGALWLFRKRERERK